MTISGKVRKIATGTIRGTWRSHYECAGLAGQQASQMSGQQCHDLSSRFHRACALVKQAQTAEMVGVRTSLLADILRSTLTAFLQEVRTADRSTSVLSKAVSAVWFDADVF